MAERKIFAGARLKRLQAAAQSHADADGRRHRRLAELPEPDRAQPAAAHRAGASEALRRLRHRRRRAFGRRQRRGGGGAEGGLRRSAADRRDRLADGALGVRRGGAQRRARDDAALRGLSRVAGAALRPLALAGDERRAGRRERRASAAAAQVAAYFEEAGPYFPAIEAEAETIAAELRRATIRTRR